MSVNPLLQYTIRLEKKCMATYLVLQRALSGADAVNALRPFYFAVHPDFFGQYPREREVNENSLKRLNGYLDNLQKPGSHSVQPVKFTFYVRDTKDSIDERPGLLTSGFRSVSFTLHTNDVLSTVLNVLKSCSLPMEHMKGFKASVETSKSPPEAEIPFYRPIKWDKTYYSFTSHRDPEQELQEARRVDPTLSLWLRNNEPDATKKHRASVPRREELNRLKTELCHKFDLADISDTEDHEDADENGEEVRGDDVKSTQGSTPNSSIHKKRKAWQVEAPDLLDRYLAAKEARDKEREEERQQCREEERDEILSFLNALAAALRRLPPQKQSFVKLQIQKLVHKVLPGILSSSCSIPPNQTCRYQLLTGIRLFHQAYLVCSIAKNM